MVSTAATFCWLVAGSSSTSSSRFLFPSDVPAAFQGAFGNVFRCSVLNEKDSKVLRCDWATFQCGDQQLYRLGEGSCHLGNRAEVYDAKLHAIQEAVICLLNTNAPRATAIICVDNRAALETLQFNKHNNEYARRALEVISDLSLLGWEISTTWCPSHCNIKGNKRADTLAKKGATLAIPCHFALTTKTWLLAQSRAELLRQWTTELPLSKPSFKIPSHLHGANWAETRAIRRVCCSRSPSDPLPNITTDPCP